MKRRGRGKNTEPKKQATFRFLESQLEWLRGRDESQSELVRIALDILINWFDICTVTGNVTPQDIVVRMLSDKALMAEIERRSKSETA